MDKYELTARIDKALSTVKDVFFKNLEPGYYVACDDVTNGKEYIFTKITDPIIDGFMEIRQLVLYEHNNFLHLEAAGYKQLDFYALMSQLRYRFHDNREWQEYPAFNVNMMGFIKDCLDSGWDVFQTRQQKPFTLDKALTNNPFYLMQKFKEYKENYNSNTFDKMLYYSDEEKFMNSYYEHKNHAKK